jgi:hypothetical protein
MLGEHIALTRNCCAPQHGAEFAASPITLQSSARHRHALWHVTHRADESAVAISNRLWHRKCLNKVAITAKNEARHDSCSRSSDVRRLHPY